jgi:arginyl-tRNA--protein-N-Asp/Glu arginylyltransferase
MSCGAETVAAPDETAAAYMASTLSTSKATSELMCQWGFRRMQEVLWRTFNGITVSLLVFVNLS